MNIFVDLAMSPGCLGRVAGGHTDEATSLVRHFLANLQRFVRREPLLDRIM